MQKEQRYLQLANKEISSGKVCTVNNCFTLGFQFSAIDFTGRYELLQFDLDVFLGRLWLEAETAEIQASKKREKRQLTVIFCW